MKLSAGFCVALLSLPLAATAQDELRLRADGGIAAERLTLWHDASAAFPVLGSPTSILDHTFLVGPRLSLGLGSGLGDAWYLDAEIAATGFVQGVFHDTDYRVGNLLFSETWSDVNGGQVQATLRFAPPQVPGVAIGSGYLRPYIAASSQATALNIHGIVCGIGCAAGARPAGESVITQTVLSGDVGLGAAWDVAPAPGHHLTLHTEARLGRLHVDDSHLLRADLGPTPNILYQFTTVTALAGLRYGWDISENLTLNLSGEVEATYGAGDAVFGPGLARPLGPFPAGMAGLGGQLSAGLSGRF